MYQLTARDKEPLTLFDRKYWWSTDESGRLTLVSDAALQAVLGG